MTRQRIRRLAEARRAYVVERRRYELASRLIDQVLEQIRRRLREGRRR